MTTLETIIERNNSGVRRFRRGRVSRAQTIFDQTLDMIAEYEQALYLTDADEWQQHPAMEPYYCFAVSISDDITVPVSTRNCDDSRGSGCNLFYSPFMCYDYRDYSTGVKGMSHFMDNVKRLKAIVVFNLALAHHILKPHAENAVTLYQFIFTTYACVDVLGAATMNNMSVWFLENERYCYARLYLTFLLQWVLVSERLLAPSDIRGFLANVTFLFMKPPITSPAA
jgi:hypothetical protein